MLNKARQRKLMRRFHRSWVEAAFVVFLTAFLFQHADPRGDGGSGVRVPAHLLPLTFPAFIQAPSRWRMIALRCVYNSVMCQWIILRLGKLGHVGVICSCGGRAWHQAAMI